MAFVPNKSHQTKNQPSGTSVSPIDGAWELYSTESGGTTTIHKKPNQIKVYSDGHFCMMAYTANGDTLYFSGFKKVIMSDGKDVTKDWGGDSFIEKKVRLKQ